MVGQGFGRKSGLRMYVEPFRWECTAQKHCVLGLAEIPSLPHSLPDDRMKPIFSTSFRKDFIQQMAQYHCIHRHNVVLCIKIWQLITDFLSGFCTRIFTALSSHFLQKSVTKFQSLFWIFCPEIGDFFHCIVPWDFFLMKSWKFRNEWFFVFFADFYRAVFLASFEWVLLHNWSERGNSKMAVQLFTRKFVEVHHWI